MWIKCIKKKVICQGKSEGKREAIFMIQTQWGMGSVINLRLFFIATVFFAHGEIFPRLVDLWKKVTRYGNTES